MFVNPLPTVALQLFNPDTVCITAGSFALTGGLPASGTYSGNGVSDGTFTLSIAGAGTHTVAYSYSNVNGYADSASQTIFLDVCAGISHYSLLKSLFIPIRTLVSSLSSLRAMQSNLKSKFTTYWEKKCIPKKFLILNP